MIAVETYVGRRVAVFGLGGSGLATAHALAAGGAQIVCFDDQRAKVLAADAAGLPTGDLRVADFAAFDALVLSPGVPLTHPTPHWSALRANAAGVPILGDVALFDTERRARLPATRFVGITGTNGKSTTTALTGHILAALGEFAQVGGNLGRPVLDFAPKAGVAVVECSSYQLDLAPELAPDVGVLLNITPDHIDRHGTFENYAAIKRRMLTGSRQAVVAIEQDEQRAFADELEAHGKPVHRTTIAGGPEALGRSGVAAVGDTLVAVEHGVAREVGSLAGVASLKGQHNAQNAAVAIAIAMALGYDPAAAASHLATFPGLPHRLEEVGRDGDVLFVNDSKATNAESTHHALSAFDRVHWIVGGRAKEGGVEPLLGFAPRVVRAYLIGEAADLFERQLEGAVATVRCGTLEAAVAAAHDAAKREGGVVLLSPASASFDQFRSFEHRGDVFRELVHARLRGES